MFGFVSLRGRAHAVLALAGALTCSAADADLLTGYSAGDPNSENTSFLVIDFDFIGADAYLFEYNYDGEATGEDMLIAISEAGTLAVGYQAFNFGERSIFVDGFFYDGNGAFPSFVGANEESWSYWIADSTSDPYTSPLAFGPSGRTLQDGSVDAWTLNVASFNSDQFPATNNPPASIPEPGSIALLGIAGLITMRRRR